MKFQHIVTDRVALVHIQLLRFAFEWCGSHVRVGSQVKRAHVARFRVFRMVFLICFFGFGIENYYV